MGDEAHCVSECGHDFRPDYLRLVAVVRKLGRPPLLALTATASPLVREEIVRRLGMRDPAVVVRGFDRPNIWLGVERHDDESAKTAALLHTAAEEAGPRIVDAATHRHVEERTRFLRSRIDMMRAYAETRDCRRRFLLQYFWRADRAVRPLRRLRGETRRPGRRRGRGDQPFPAGSRVVHPEWGEGLVQRAEADLVTVAFESAGYRTLDPRFVQEHRLLRRIDEAVQPSARDG